jgi:lysyl-tRNA synthetase class 1
MSDLRDAALVSKAWPFEEARRLLKRYKDKAPEKGYVLFQTGYGPSGLPHIGTFGEVARTSMVRHAFEQISDIPTRLICFSDDMDGFRKVPTNLPMQEELKQDLHLPLTRVRDPFGTHDGFAQHNNARLCAFLDSFGFEYEFASATEYYRSGRFDEMLWWRWSGSTRSWKSCCRRWGPNGRRPIRPSCRYRPGPGMCCRCPRWSAMSPGAPSYMKSRMASAWKCRSRAAM